jgi:dephospho-CoA kinase
MKVPPETAQQEIARRAAAQLPDEQKVKAADYVIENSGSLDETRRQVREVYEKLVREAAHR